MVNYSIGELRLSCFPEHLLCPTPKLDPFESIVTPYYQSSEDGVIFSSEESG